MDIAALSVLRAISQFSGISRLPRSLFSSVRNMASSVRRFRLDSLGLFSDSKTAPMQPRAGDPVEEIEEELCVAEVELLAQRTFDVL
jgi:hypothetical protein